ncbi:zinc dependent phospholipase C family protein [Ornithinibacillus bavariensis]|uniref:Phospholipase C/D domain-containing protein n=1 Tax=Ornithinibacillus bavariensis TaxID=545502 RepID=A0A920C6G4_9BACI|nr:zinc dependent phospholipase C family protein [Ornithinibacillus bavariensis]GIO25662.1 hypothetical protein J43TS3_02730 [Ornithinibacillus bavariensis]
MPNIWTHMLFCEDMLDAISKPENIPSRSYILNLGAQGPDPFFYYNFWPWIKDASIPNIGNLLHRKKCGDFLMDIIVSAKDSSTEIKSYVFGFVTHHILDRIAHPFINYYAGYEGNNHSKYEIIIDTLMMERYKNLKTWKTPVYKEILLNKQQKNEIANFLYQAIRKHYPEVTESSSSYIKKAFKDMKLALMILSDPYGWKNKLLKKVISAFSHQPITNHKDYLNLEHQTWYHPATKKPSTKSFIDLYEQARIEGIEIMKKVIDYWYNNGTSREDLEGLIGDISYDTGLPLKLKLENQYSEPIL